MATPNSYSDSVVLQVAQLCQGYMRIDIEKAKQFRSRSYFKQSPLLLYLVSKSLSYSIDSDPNSIATDTVANYAWALCSGYTARALTALGQGSGGVIIPGGGGQAINLRWVTTSFVVGGTGSLVSAGSTSFTVADSYIQQDSVAFGYTSASPMPRTGTVTDPQNTYAVTYTNTGITITLNYAVSNNEQYTLTYVKATSASGGSSGGGVPVGNNPGQVLFTDGGTGQYWADVIKDYTSADFSSDHVTVVDTSLVNNTLDIFWNELGRFLNSDEFSLVTGGGFKILIAGFDSSAATYHFKVMLKGLYS